MKNMGFNMGRLTDAQQKMGIKEVANQYDAAMKNAPNAQGANAFAAMAQIATLKNMLHNVMDELVANKVAEAEKTLTANFNEKILAAKMADMAAFVTGAMNEAGIAAADINELQKIIQNPTANGLDAEFGDVLGALGPIQLEMLTSTVASVLDIDAGNLISLPSLNPNAPALPVGDLEGIIGGVIAGVKGTVDGILGGGLPVDAGMVQDTVGGVVNQVTDLAGDNPLDGIVGSIL